MSKKRRQVRGLGSKIKRNARRAAKRASSLASELATAVGNNQASLHGGAEQRGDTRPCDGVPASVDSMQPDILPKQAPSDGGAALQDAAAPSSDASSIDSTLPNVFGGAGKGECPHKCPSECPHNTYDCLSSPHNTLPSSPPPPSPPPPSPLPPCSPRRRHHRRHVHLRRRRLHRRHLRRHRHRRRHHHHRRQVTSFAVT